MLTGPAGAIRPTTTSAAIARIFSTMRPLCTLLPDRTPKQLMIVSSASTATATMLSATAMCVISPK